MRLPLIRPHQGQRQHPKFRPAADRARPRLEPGLWQYRGRAAAHCLPAAYLAQQRLRLRRRHRIHQVRQYRPAPVIALDRHAALAPLGMRPHQRPPRSLMRPVNGQQLLRNRDQRLRLLCLVPLRLPHAARPVPQPLPLGLQPNVECLINPVQLLQQLAIQQRQRPRVRRGRPQHLVHVHPNQALPQRQAIAVDRQDLGPGWRQHLQQPVDLLPQRGPCLLLRAPAPQQLCQPRPQHRPRLRQCGNRQQRPRLPPRRQHAVAVDRPGLHLPDQPEAKGDHLGRSPECTSLNICLGTVHDPDITVLFTRPRKANMAGFTISRQPSPTNTQVCILYATEAH